MIVQSDGEIVHSPARIIYFVTIAGSSSENVIAISHCCPVETLELITFSKLVRINNPVSGEIELSYK